MDKLCKLLHDHISWTLMGLLLLKLKALLFWHTILLNSDFIWNQSATLQFFLDIECKLLVKRENQLQVHLVNIVQNFVFDLLFICSCLDAKVLFIWAFCPWRSVPWFFLRVRVILNVALDRYLLDIGCEYFLQELFPNGMHLVHGGYRVLLQLIYKLENLVALPLFIANVFVDKDLRELVDNVKLMHLPKDRAVGWEIEHWEILCNQKNLCYPWHKSFV